MEEDEGTAARHPFASSLKYAALLGASALVFVSGMASGMLVDGTSETLVAYRMKMQTFREPPPLQTPASVTNVRQQITSTYDEAPVVKGAWFPQNNTVRWDVSLAPGQDMSGLSIRNMHSDRNLVVVLNAIGSDGEWIRAGVVNVAAGGEGAVHPPTGSYAMTVLSLPVTTPYSDLDRATPSRTVYFDLFDPETADTVPRTRFQFANGQPQRLPDLDYRPGDQQDASEAA